MGREHERALYEATLDALVNSGKLSMINRSAELWRTIENELALQDFIDPKSAIDLGKMSGARHLITGEVIRFSCDPKTKPNGGSYYNSWITVTLKIVNLETGKYEQSVMAEVDRSDDQYDIAIKKAIEDAAQSLSRKILAAFPISAKVQKQISETQITIDKGSVDGVRAQDVYTVYDDDREIIGTFKITWTASNESTGRILRGEPADMIGKHAKETYDERNVNTARIEKKEGAYVIINAGKDMGVKAGDVFKSVETHEENAGTITIRNQTVAGKIYITKAHKEYSEGKIFRGVNTINPELELVESNNDKGIKKNFFRVGYKSAVGITIKPNVSSGDGYVNITTGLNTYRVETNYLDLVKPITSIQIYTVAYGVKNLVKNLTTSIQADIYSMGELNNWIGHLNVLYDCPIIPEKLYWSVGPSLGYGRLKQNIPDGTVMRISGGESQDIRAKSIYLALNTNVNITVSRVVFTAGVSADYLRYKRWQYTSESIIVDASKAGRVTAPQEIVPYHDVDLSGLYYSGSVSYYLNR